MRMKKTVTLLIIFGLFTWVLSSSAQQAIVTGGDYLAHPSGSLSFTVGETFIESYVSDNLALTQGMQQPVITITALDDINLSGISVYAYPNPVSELLMLKTGNSENKNLKYQIFDLNGKLLIERKIESVLTEIPMDQFIPSTYLLTVIAGDKFLARFRIVKL
jgi:hypothetical protein